MAINFLLDQVAEEKRLAFEYDQESFASFDDFVDGVKAAINDTFDWIANNHNTAEIVTPAVLGAHHQKLSELGYTALRNVNVYLPPYCKTDIVTYVGEVFKQLTQLSDIEQRLYTPLGEHMQFAASLEDYHNKPMTSREYRTVNVDRMKKDLQRVNANGDSPDELKVISEYEPFDKCFRSLNALKDAEKLMVKIGEIHASINLVNLQKKEKEILDNLNLLLDKIAQGEKAELTAGAKKQMAQNLMQVADETEYLALMLFVSNTAIEAWNKTVMKLLKHEA